MDYIRDKYIRLNTEIKKGYYRVIDIDIHLQRRRIESLFNKAHSK